MASETTKNKLENLLLKEVAQFYKNDRRTWKEPVVDTLRDIRRMNLRAVFFGGTLRSLLASRLHDERPGRPRDVDIVVSGIHLEELRELFQELINRETRFGGLQVRRREWQFDLWPLKQTWAFVEDAVENPDFAALPTTTFFNLEAIAVDVWAPQGKRRKVYSGNGQFFEGIARRVLEINRERNPFPELCVLRALIMAMSINFQIGPKLAGYIAKHGPSISAKELDSIQYKHYGQIRGPGETFCEWIDFVRERHRRDSSAPIALPLLRNQLELWDETNEHTRIRVHALPKPN